MKDIIFCIFFPKSSSQVEKNLAMAEPNSDRMMNLLLQLLQLKRRLAELNRLLIQRRLAELRQIDAEIANLDRHGKENKKP